MNVDAKTLLFQYFNSVDQKINTLTNVSNIAKVTEYQNGNSRSWDYETESDFAPDADDYQGTTKLTKNSGYILYSLNAPYTLTFPGTEQLPSTFTITETTQIVRYLGPTKKVTDVPDYSTNIRKITIFDNGNSRSWDLETQLDFGVDADDYQGFTNLENGTTYLIYSLVGFTPYVLYDNSTTCTYADEGWTPSATGLCGIIAQSNYGSDPTCAVITRSFDTGKTETCVTINNPYTGPETVCTCN